MRRVRRIGSRDLDLLEYQGKQLLAKHGVPVPDGRVADTASAAVEAAEEVGYPCVVKAQVRIGKRGKAGGIKIANDRDEARSHAEAILGMDIRRLHRSRGLGRARLEDRRRVLRLADPRPLGEEAPRDALAHGRHGHRGDRRDRSVGAGPAPHRARRGVHRRGCQRDRDRRPDRRGRDRPGGGAPGQAARRRARRGRDPDRGQSADRHLRSRGRRPRLEDDDRQQRPVQARGAGRASRPLRRGSAGADGEGEGAHLREARRQHRHPRQRGRALHVDARRGRPGGRQAGELPRRRRGLEGGRDRRRARGDHLGRERERDPVQHLRRDHPLRRDRQGDHRGVGEDRDRRAAGGAARRHQLRGGAGAARRAPSLPDLHLEKTMLGAAERVVELASG